MRPSKIIIGSRGSKLALWQANYVKDTLFKLGINSQIKIIKTKGDRIQHLSFDKIEGKGFFTKEIEAALLDQDIDLAVHSLKDLETDQPKGLSLGAIPVRENPSDTLLINKNAVDPSNYFDIINKGVVGTSSARRKNQLLLFREDLIIKDLRGNVPTRINKLKDGLYDAIVLARAGLNRLEIDISKFHVLHLSPSIFIPAPAQGALGLQIRNNDEYLINILSKINHKETEGNVAFERRILNGIGGGCHSPMGAFSKINQNGKRNTWVTFSENVDKTPIRFFSDSESTEEILEKIKQKKRSKTVWISRELNSDSILRKLLENSSCYITAQSLIEKTKLSLEFLPKCDWIFFNSSFCYDSIKQLKSTFKNKKIAAFGDATARHLKAQNLKVSFIGTGCPKNVAKDFKSTIDRDDVVFFPSSNISVGTVQKLIHEKNKTVKKSYETKLLEKIIEHHDYFIFTSPSNVEAYVKTNSLKGLKAISIGPTTTQSLKDNGATNIYQASESSELALADIVLNLI